MDTKLIQANGPFFRGKVLVNIDDRMDGRIGVYLPDFHSHLSNDETLFTNMNLGEITAPNFIIASPILGINKSANDELKYQNNSGRYSVPRVGSYVMVFFLNNDPTQCFYFPKDFSIPFPDQRIFAMNLSDYNKEDFNDIVRKVNMEINEYYNGNIIGINNNDDINEFFLIFDNGTEIAISSPNERIDNTPNYTPRNSHSKRPSFLKFLIKRKDSLFKSIFRMLTNKVNSEITIGVEKNSLAERGVGLNYNDVEDTPEEISATQKFLVNDKSILSSLDTEYRIGDKIISSNDIILEDEFAISKKKLQNYSENNNENYNYLKEIIVRKEEIEFNEKIESNFNLEGKITLLENNNSKIEKTIKNVENIIKIENTEKKKKYYF